MKNPFKVIGNFFRRIFEKRQSSLDVLAKQLHAEPDSSQHRHIAESYSRKNPPPQGNIHPLVVMINAAKSPQDKIIIALAFQDKVTDLQSFSLVLDSLPCLAEKRWLMPV